MAKSVMPLLITAILFSCAGPTETGVSFDYRPYATIAIAIMDSLDIPVRPDYREDPPIKFILTDMKKSGETETKPGRSLDSNIVYTLVKIRISPEIWKALHVKDTVDFKHRFAVGTIIHELVHVFQYPDTISINTGDTSDLTNRLEVDASSVMTYYLMSKTAPESLRQLALQFKENKQKLRSHLNRFFYYKQLNQKK